MRSLALALALLLAHCANLSCPPEQQLGAGSCVCSSTLTPPVDGMCLRDACTAEGCPCTVEGIESAIARGGVQVLQCGPNATPVSTTETIVIDNDVVLNGQGNLAITGDGNHLILDVQADTVTLMGITVMNGDHGIRVADNASVTLTNCEVSGNTSRSSGGGGIFNEGNLTLIETTVKNNIAQVGSGGGIQNGRSGMLTLSSSRVTGNDSNVGPGGGIGNQGTVRLLNESEVSGNNAKEHNGGGISNENGEVHITDSVVKGNTSAAYGGGLSTEGADGRVYVTGSTVSGNQATGDNQGGGLWCRDGLVESERSTWSANESAQSGGGFYIEGGGALLTLKSSTVSANLAGNVGGGVRVYNNAKADIVNSTIYGNESTQGGGDGIHLQLNAAAVTLNSSTISSNSDGGTGISVFGKLIVKQTVIDDACLVNTTSGSVESENHNIESPGDTCRLDGDDDSVNVTPVVLNLAGELEDNGGDTLTLIPERSSLAVDYFLGICAQSDDQRGVSRAQGPRCDIGAVEVEPGL